MMFAKTPAMPRSATLGALALLGGGLLMYWAFAGWGLFGLGKSKLLKGRIPKDAPSTNRHGGHTEDAP